MFADATISNIYKLILKDGHKLYSIRTNNKIWIVADNKFGGKIAIANFILKVNKSWNSKE